MSPKPITPFTSPPHPLIYMEPICHCVGATWFITMTIKS